MRAVTAHTASGPVRGRLDDQGMTVFKGIPYARPPVGERRFLAPAPPDPWLGTRDAFELGPGCWQVPSPTLPVGPSMDEDCLYLNVWTPEAATGGARPVMVWLHGGAFHFGSCASPSTDGSRLARRGDVVVVSLNHRLNVFGFLHLQDALGDEAQFAGHAGMLDIVQALRWVRENIAAFGGDPDQVTVFGESGGGRKVSVLMAMPQAKGLFHRAIVQSGAHPRLVPRALADRFARGLIASLPGSQPGVPASLRNLQAMPAAQLFDSTVRYVDSVRDPALPASPGARWLVMSPVLDGHHLAHHPFDPAAPAGRDVPLLIGTTKDESALFLARSTDPTLIDEPAMRERLRALLGDRADRLLAAHERARPGESPWTRLVALSSEDRRLLSIETAEQKLRQGGAPVYMYWFTWETDQPWLMSAHTLEIPFVFDTVQASPITGSSPRRQELADQLCDTWVAFARTGHPVHAGLPYWPAYQLPERGTMVLDLPLRLVADPRGDERRAWQGPVPMPWEPGASVGAV
jgi:para-nitrobenzyl esterase